MTGNRRVRAITKFLEPLDRHDAGPGVVSGLAALVLYVFTAAPNVTLLDSGEFILAAMAFGVPHPTGYPLWTMGAWLFTLLPLGNAAWEVNLFSGVCAAAAIGLLAAMLSSILRWFFPAWTRGGSIWRGFPAVIACAMSLAVAACESVWTQAVIAEVYALHLLIALAFTLAIYRWIREPQKVEAFVQAVCLLALGLSNHHLMFVLAPLLVVVLVLLRRDIWLEAGLYLAFTFSLAYLGFAWLSDDPETQSAARRFFCLVSVILVLARAARGRFLCLSLWPKLLAAVAVGLLPYLYLPVASSTNPPMNWGYTQTREGFFYSINRSQYSGKLSEQLLQTVGRMVGKTSENPSRETRTDASRLEGSNEGEFVAAYWFEAVKNFTILSVLFFLLALVLGLRLLPNQRVLVLACYLAFFLSAFLQPLLSGAGGDLSSWLLQMPYLGYSFAYFGILAAIGAAGLIAIWKSPLMRAVTAFCICGLPVFGFFQNHKNSSQREHWFGWEYGHRMLADLPRHAVVVAGTDPGRFICSYMILGESAQPSRVKRDPNFDRRDLFVITQNAAGDPFYLNYVRDHYGAERPRPAAGWFERFLGRADQYPPDTLVLPSEEEVQRIIAPLRDDIVNRTEMEAAGILNSEVMRWIWEKNRAHHEFFVEESFPMEWSYPYAIPRGLGYMIQPEEVPELADEIVAADFEYWEGLISRLTSDPHFEHDHDARRAYAKARATGANLYRFRKMDEQAFRAYSESLLLWPGHHESLVAIVTYLCEQQRFDAALEAVAAARAIDPGNRGWARLSQTIRLRAMLAGKIRELEAAAERSPENHEVTLQLLENYTAIGDLEKAEALAAHALESFSTEPKWYADLVLYHLREDAQARAVEAGQKWVKIEPKNVDAWIMLARACLEAGQEEAFHDAAAEAVRVGGEAARQRLVNEPGFERAKFDPRFEALVRPYADVF